MRKKVIAGNWKMNTDLSEAVELISGIKNSLDFSSVSADVIVCPPFVSLETAAELTKETPIKVGAQNMFYEESGAFTGEISAKMLKSVGCEYVILGHSERRAIFGESNEWINKKIAKALSEELNVIFCIGETLEEREKGIMEDVLRTQITEGLAGISAEQMKNVIIAYEPVWAIGTGKTATPEQAEAAHKFIRGLVAELYDGATAENLTVQYGGSVKPNNAKELLSQPNIDGALVGGAALKADSFVEIVKAAE
jgi:triosephosphate isomerase